MFEPRPKMANSSRFSVLWHFTHFGLSNFWAGRVAPREIFCWLFCTPYQVRNSSSAATVNLHLHFAWLAAWPQLRLPVPGDLWVAESESDSESKLPTGEFFGESDSKLAAASLGRRTLSGHGENCYSITDVLVRDSRCSGSAGSTDEKIWFAYDKRPVSRPRGVASFKLAMLLPLAPLNHHPLLMSAVDMPHDWCLFCVSWPLFSFWPAALPVGLEVQLGVRIRSFAFDPIGTDPPAPDNISSQGGCCSLLFSTVIATSVCSTLSKKKPRIVGSRININFTHTYINVK